MEHRGHAVVLGASMSGLLAARALSEVFERVTVVERDRLPQHAEHRKGVPQSQHAHGLLSSGLNALEQLFPGLGASLVDRGASPGDALGSSWWCIGGRPLARGDSGLLNNSCSRPLLEASVRQRVRALQNVTVVDGCDVLGLLGDAQRVSGVRVLRRADGSSEERLLADLVVDCSGRGSRLPTWLEAFGLPAPEEERVRVDITYVSFLVRRRAADLAGARVAVIGAAPPNPRCGVALAIEGDRYIVTLVGYFGEHPGTDEASQRAFAAQLPAPWLHELLADAERESAGVVARFPGSQRRRYERLARFPSGLLVHGDAMCAFNPIYGQGMSVAALEAKLLQQAVREDWSSRRYFEAASRLIDVPWTIAVGNDLRFPQLAAAQPASARLVGAYMRRLVSAASNDASVATSFLKATQLETPLSSLFSPPLVARVLWRGGKARLPSLLGQPRTPASPSPALQT